MMTSHSANLERSRLFNLWFRHPWKLVHFLAHSAIWICLRKIEHEICYFFTKNQAFFALGKTFCANHRYKYGANHRTSIVSTHQTFHLVPKHFSLRIFAAKSWARNLHVSVLPRLAAADLHALRNFGKVLKYLQSYFETFFLNLFFKNQRISTNISPILSSTKYGSQHFLIILCEIR